MVRYPKGITTVGFRPRRRPSEQVRRSGGVPRSRRFASRGALAPRRAPRAARSGTPSGCGRYCLPFLATLWLLGSLRPVSAAGTWSVLSLPQQPGEVFSPTALAIGAAGDLYVADQSKGGQIQRRDTQGHWSVLATAGDAPGQVDNPATLAVDTADNLYVPDYADGGRIQKREAQGNWSVIAAAGTGIGQVDDPRALTVDTSGSLYVADEPQLGNGVAPGLPGRIQKRDAQGQWSVIAAAGFSLGQVYYPRALAVDTVGNLYALDDDDGPIRKRDAQGHWSVILGGDPDGVSFRVPTALALDIAGNLYVASEHVIDFGLGGYGALIRSRSGTPRAVGR